jgi:hypothetical protein
VKYNKKVERGCRFILVNERVDSPLLRGTFPAMSKPGEAIWDWEVIKALYLGGMELKDIIQVPRFSKLGLKYLQNRASEEKWRASRDEARAEGTGQIAKGLIAKMAEAEHDHQEWLLETLKDHQPARRDSQASTRPRSTPATQRPTATPRSAYQHTERNNRRGAND